MSCFGSKRFASANLEDLCIRTDKIREHLGRKDVVLLKASVMARLLAEGRLKDKMRQEIEREYPDAIADAATVQRCLREVEVTALGNQKWPRTIPYPGLVVMSHVWMTKNHPDPQGNMGVEIAKMLHWYAAQRAQYTESLLYKTGSEHDPNNYIDDVEFNSDFIFFMDCWSLHQGRRSADQEDAFRRAQREMHFWYGHKGTMVFLLRKTPDNWRENAEFVRKRGYKFRGWTHFEQKTAGLCAAPGMCLDMEAFEKAIRTARHDEYGRTYGEISLQLTGFFEGASDEELRSLSMWQSQFDATADARSCLHTLAMERQTPPISIAQMRSELHANKAFSRDEDREVCALMYEEVMTALMGDQLKLTFASKGGWGWREWKNRGSSTKHYTLVEELDLWHNVPGKNRSAELGSFFQALGRNWMPNLKTITIYMQSEFDKEGWDTIRHALRRGAMPQLHTVTAFRLGSDAWEAAVSGDGGARAKVWNVDSSARVEKALGCCVS